ncbi:24292_t:CDS:2, partial [Racocetra persica]
KTGQKHKIISTKSASDAVKQFVQFIESKDRSASSIIIDFSIYACDKELIFRDSYRHLVAVQLLLKREHIIAAYYKEINKIMEKNILIKSFDSNLTVELPPICPTAEENNEIFINKEQIGISTIKSLTKLLITLIPDLTTGDNPVLYQNDIIKIKLSGDG